MGAMDRAVAGAGPDRVPTLTIHPNGAGGADMSGVEGILREILQVLAY
jgi:hypothetical protein